MNQWNKQYEQATKVLTLAYAADLAAYDAVALESKSFWAERTPDSWPRVDAYRSWREARLALTAAELTVVEVLRWHCVAIRLGLPTNSIAPKHAALLTQPLAAQRTDRVLAYFGEQDELHGQPPSDRRGSGALGHSMPAAAAATAFPVTSFWKSVGKV